jgi:uncharacterized protein (DUF1778 family)
MMSTRRTMHVIAAVALLVLTYTIMLSTAALNGRAIIADNKAIRADFDNTAEMIVLLDAPRLGKRSRMRSSPRARATCASVPATRRCRCWCAQAPGLWR